MSDSTTESTLNASLRVWVKEGTCLFPTVLGRWYWNRASLIFPEFQLGIWVLGSGSPYFKAELGHVAMELGQGTGTESHLKNVGDRGA